MGDALHTHGGVTDAREARLAQAGGFAVQGPTALDARTGVLTGPGSTALATGTSATAPMTVAIAPHHWFTSRGSANGPYLGVLEAGATVNIAAAPAAGAGTRIDVVYVRQKDSTAGVPTPDAATAPEYGVITGVAGGAKPSLASAPGAEELATVAVAPGATATNGANVTITQTARQTVARGARIPVRNQAERDALTAFPSLEVYRLDTGQVQLCTAAGPPATWVTTYDPATVLPTTGNLSLVNGYQAASTTGGTPKWRRAVQEMALQGGITNTGTVYAASAGTDYKLADLPAGTAPGVDLPFTVPYASGTAYASAWLWVRADGTVWYRPHANASSGFSVSLTGVNWRIGV